jgi:hypothetical protein
MVSPKKHYRKLITHTHTGISWPQSLARHKRIKHGIDTAAITQQRMPLHLTENGTTYKISMPEYKQIGQCPVPNCNTIIKDRHGIH